MGAIKTGVTISLGPFFGVVVNVLSAVDDDAKSTGFNTLCVGTDKAHVATRVHQELVCGECKNTNAETFVKGKDMGDGTYAIVDQDVLAAAATVGDDIKTELRITSHDAAKVAAATMPLGKTYFLEPGKGPRAQEGYALLREQVRRRSDKAYVSVFASRSKPMMYRLGVYGQALTIVPQAWPTNIRAEPNVPDVDVDEAALTQLDALLDTLEQPFDPATYIDTRKDAMEAVIAAATMVEAGQTPDLKSVKSVAPAGLDLTSQLTAAVAAAKAAKPKVTRKAAPAKKAPTKKAPPAKAPARKAS
jgi:non-homologous end joining protein Ku